MAIGRSQDKPNPLRLSSSRNALAPAEVVTLRNLVEIKAMWDKGWDAVYRAVMRGELRAYGRPGRQKYYSESELTMAFGEPVRPLDPSSDEDGLAILNNVPSNTLNR